jgi:hypothetical protein
VGLGGLRMLVDKLGHVEDLIVDHDEEVLLGVMLGNVLVGEGGHCIGRVVVYVWWCLLSGQLLEAE